ncbi:MAG: DegT/DnrJ/EryC1/StrS family aminotransferase [Chitinophagaceae bacterium]|nr:MAG: DegT/DnrJ/EryC1/StrS family aminotransferase [Chitinophagaceae bacterium]
MIQVFEPEVIQADMDHVMEAVKNGEISGSFGKFIPEFEKNFAAYIGVKHGVAVSNGSTALHLAVAALSLPAGSEILVSACTNIATALGAVHNNCIPVPVDSEPDTWNLDPSKIEALITPKTKAIIVVHIYGHPVDMDPVMTIADKHNLIVIEDCAESHGATYKGKMTGSIGHMSCFSFYANKIITTGEGGMVMTNDDKLATRLAYLRNLAFGKPRFIHQDAGFNFRLTGMQAALGVSQLSRIDETLEKKRAIAAKYNEKLRDISWLELPVEKDYAKNVYWMYCIVLTEKSGYNKDAFMKYLSENDVDTRSFFCPMDLQPFIIELIKDKNIECRVARGLWERGIYIPSSHNISDKEIDQVVSVIKKYHP